MLYGKGKKKNARSLETEQFLRSIVYFLLDTGVRQNLKAQVLNITRVRADGTNIWAEFQIKLSSGNVKYVSIGKSCVDRPKRSRVLK